MRAHVWHKHTQSVYNILTANWYYSDLYGYIEQTIIKVCKRHFSICCEGVPVGLLLHQPRLTTNTLLMNSDGHCWRNASLQRKVGVSVHYVMQIDVTDELFLPGGGVAKLLYEERFVCACLSVSVCVWVFSVVHVCVYVFVCVCLCIDYRVP